MASQSDSGSVDSSNNVINASVSQDDISNTPLWRYVTKLPKTMTKLKLQQKIVPLPPSSQTLAFSFRSNITSLQGHSLGSKRRKGHLEQSFNLDTRENLDTRNPHYVNAFTLASKNSILGYILSRCTKTTINFMVVSEGGVVFLKVVNSEKEYKDNEVEVKNVVQVISGNAPVCKAVGSLEETQDPYIFWTPCVVHTLNLALKNICAIKNIEKNEVTYDVLCWINNVGDNSIFIRNFIISHSMRLAIFNSFLIKQGLQNMVVSDEWSTYREDDVSKAYLVKEKNLDDIWWDKVDYILTFTIYDMLRIMDTNKPTLHLVYEMWDEMIEKVKKNIYRHEGKKGDERSIFYEVSSTPLHCMAHSLNPRYYCNDLLNKVPNRLPPHKDVEILEERNKCLRRYFSSIEERKMELEYKMWDIGSDVFDSFEGVEIPGVASLSLDELDMEMVIFDNEEEDMENANAMN
ncbi:hypothetical protein ES332_A08G128600v1 [Gossypium tomentosum]|nr:hypothetical protein ES332_A08G128600v1 [Gossypium tomentosum]